MYIVQSSHTLVCTQLLVCGTFSAVPQVGVNDIHTKHSQLWFLLQTCTVLSCDSLVAVVHSSYCTIPTSLILATTLLVP